MDPNELGITIAIAIVILAGVVGITGIFFFILMHYFLYNKNHSDKFPYILINKRKDK